MSSRKPDDTSLYGLPRPRNLANGKEISSSTTLSFTSQLSSLINNQPSSERGTSKGSRPGRKSKDDIFTTHNRNTHKRAKLDLEPDDRPALSSQQKHSTHSAAVERSVLDRSRRKMQEKSRLYAAMKRGDVADDDGKYGVDFDRKWAEAQAREGKGDEEEDDDDDEDDSDSDPATDLIEYTDEFGRTRTGTAREAARAKHAHTAGRDSRGDEQGLAVTRPSAPANLIYGDAIQVDAFQPDARIAAAMDALARKRDRSLTPPPDGHFDARREIRTKGTGFYGFSAETEARKREMDGLEQERAETERRREERSAMLEERRKAVEARRRGIVEKRGKKQADDFLDELETEMVEKGIGTAGGSEIMERIHAAVDGEEIDQEQQQGD